MAAIRKGAFAPDSWVRSARLPYPGLFDSRGFAPFAVRTQTADDCRCYNAPLSVSLCHCGRIWFVGDGAFAPEVWVGSAIQPYQFLFAGIRVIRGSVFRGEAGFHLWHFYRSRNWSSGGWGKPISASFNAAQVPLRARQMNGSITTSSSVPRRRTTFSSCRSKTRTPEMGCT